MQKIFIVFIVVLLVGYQSIKAQETALEPVVVTGSLHQQKIKETGRNIILISK